MFGQRCKTFYRLGKKLKELLEERDTTQKEFAQVLNVAPSTISSYVQNAREPDFETLRKMAAYFEVSLDYLLSDEPEGTNDYLEAELLRLFRAMSAIQKEMFVEQGKAMVRVSRKYS